MNSQISTTVGADGDGVVRLQGLVRKHRHKWFAHTSREAENGWSGPHDHIEDAARAALLAWEAEGDTCYIAQGRKLTKAEYEEQGAEYTWEVDTLNAMKLVLPNDALCRPADSDAGAQDIGRRMTETELTKIKRMASDLAAIAVERALSKDWKEHPMFGIAVDKDKWATTYQEQLQRLDATLRESSNN